MTVSYWPLTKIPSKAATTASSCVAAWDPSSLKDPSIKLGQQFYPNAGSDWKGFN